MRPVFYGFRLIRIEDEKTLFLLLLAAFCGVLTAAAQDLIVKTDASRIEAKVVEITTDAVRYKKFSYPAGPTYVLPVKQIAYIRYANGETEYYAESVPAAELTPAEPAEGTETRGGEEYVVKRYEIGELYDRNGVRGIVCCLSEDGRHGLVVSLDQIYLPWSEFRKPDLRTVGTTNRSDGRENMKKIVEEYIAANGLSWDDFPAFKWCREKGEGWYLPAIDELLNIGHNYNGGSRAVNNRRAHKAFNGALQEAGGKRMDRLVYYFSSTETRREERLHLAHEYRAALRGGDSQVQQIPRARRARVLTREAGRGAGGGRPAPAVCREAEGSGFGKSRIRSFLFRRKRIPEDGGRLQCPPSLRTGRGGRVDRGLPAVTRIPGFGPARSGFGAVQKCRRAVFRAKGQSESIRRRSFGMMTSQPYCSRT